MAENTASTRGEDVEEWQRIPATGTVPPPRSGAASCIVGDELYLFGGTGDGGTLDDFWKHSFKDAAWEQVHAMSDVKPDKRSFAGICFCDKNLAIYMFGGNNCKCGICVVALIACLQFPIYSEITNSFSLPLNFQFLKV